MAKSNDSKLTIATGSLLVPFISRWLPLPPGVLEPAPDPISFSAERAEQVQALYDLLSKEGKPRLVAQDGGDGLRAARRRVRPAAQGCGLAPARKNDLDWCH